MIARGTPRHLFPQLFRAVQAKHLFDDSKTFVDATPRRAAAAINADFERQQAAPGFDLLEFVHAQFDLPEAPDTAGEIESGLPVEQRVERLWDVLTRAADDDDSDSSLIPLPNPYIVPGGRFREIYYWDSYFTMLGLAESGRVDLIRNMVDNFAFLIDQIGFVPNGNRSYYCSRSQPPYFSLMVELLEAVSGDERVCVHYQPQLLREYAFWMAGEDDIAAHGGAERRVVKTADGCLNRYWDDEAEPRQESYAEDEALAAHAGRDAAGLYRNLRAAAESGWDFSSRWLEDGRSLSRVCTTEVLPVDLNALMFNLECRIARNFEEQSRSAEAADFRRRADDRRHLIVSRFFDEGAGMFVDLGLRDLRPTGRLSLAAAYPLIFDIATEEQGFRVARRLNADFLRAGGWVTTLTDSGQQWDSPNGWAPLQWVVFDALQRHGFADEAREGALRWVGNVCRVYEATGRLMEKYDVVSVGHAGGGGEYDVQDGFGWTNGVLLRLQRELTAPA